MKVDLIIPQRKVAFGSHTTGLRILPTVEKEFAGTDVFAGIQEASKIIASDEKMPKFDVGLRKILGIPFLTIRKGKQWLKLPESNEITKENVRDLLVQEAEKLKKAPWYKKVLMTIGLK